MLVYVGDVVGTGSSRKSAVNSLLWHTGTDIPYVPNKRFGGVCLGNKIAPIFYNTLEDAGALPIELDVSQADYSAVLDLQLQSGGSESTGSSILHVNHHASFRLGKCVVFDQKLPTLRLLVVVLPERTNIPAFDADQFASW